MVPAFKLAWKAYFRGLGQVAFTDSAIGGALVLVAITFISPWAAFGAFVGCLVGTLAGVLLPTYTRNQWDLGLSGFNSAIVGIFWGGFLASGAWNLAIFILALALCIGLEALLLRFLGRFDLPVLSLPAVLTGYLLTLLYASLGSWFWVVGPPPPFGAAGVIAAILLISGTMLAMSVAAALQALLIGAVAAAISSLIFQVDVFALWGLWALTVVPASFAMHGVFLAGSMIGSLAGLLAALIGAVFWVLWVVTGLEHVVPPLLLPFILGTWISILVFRRIAGSAFLKPDIWLAAKKLIDARDAKKPVIAVVGATPDTGSKSLDCQADYPVRSDPRFDRFTFDDFMASRHNRRLYWDLAALERERATKSERIGDYDYLLDLERQGWLQATLTDAFDGACRLGGMGEAIELRGRVDRIGCVACDWRGDWPPAGIWRHYDLLCPDCSGFLKPAVRAYGEGLAPEISEQVSTLVSQCAVMLVLDVAAQAPTIEAVLERARLARVQFIYIHSPTFADNARPGDLLLSDGPQVTLKALTRLLRFPSFVRVVTKTAKVFATVILPLRVPA